MGLLEDIFELYDWDEPINDTELFYVQQVYFARHPDASAVTILLQKYNLSPNIVLDSLLMIHDTPSLCNLEYFPYLSCLKLLHSCSECLEMLCSERHSLFTNLLYRVVASTSSAGTVRTLDYLEILLGFSCSKLILEDASIWGLSRKRVGVATRYDSSFYRAIHTSDLDITDSNLLSRTVMFNGTNSLSNTFSRSVSLFSGHFEFNPNQFGSTDEPSTYKSLESVQLPCFLDCLLNVQCKLFNSMNDSPTADNTSPTADNRPVLDMLGIGMFHDFFSSILVSFLTTRPLKEHFLAAIQNVCNQDRKKLVFDADTNCSDEYAYNLYSLLIRIAKGSFKHSLIPKLGSNLIPTFSFFNLARLIDISLLKLIRPWLSGDKEYDSQISGDIELLKKYIEFVYDVINYREKEVFSPLICKLRNTEESANDNELASLNQHVDLIDLFLDDKKANKVSELLNDHSFIDVILNLQLFFQKTGPDTCLKLVSHLLIFENPHKLLCLKILAGINWNDELVLRRLIRHYSEKNLPDQEYSRSLINGMVQNRKVKTDYHSLRMVNCMVSDLEEWISKLVKSIQQIKTYKIKDKRILEIFKEIKQGKRYELSAISDDEDASPTPPDRFKVLLNYDDKQLELIIRSRLGIQATDEEVNHEVKEIKATLLYFKDPLLFKIKDKAKRNKEKLKNSENGLKQFAYLVENIMSLMVSWTEINRRLFLNRNIFQRLFLIIGQLLFDFLGRKSATFRIQNSDEYDYRPNRILRGLLLITKNLLGDAPSLISKCKLDSTLLEKGAELAREKYLLEDHRMDVLFGIIRVLKETAEQNDENEADEDIPEEFIDPLTFMMMENPVKLLTSKETIDRRTFDQLMLGDQIDPFSRLPLDSTKIVPDDELRRAIQEYMRRTKTS